MQSSFLQWLAVRFLDRPLQPRELLRARKIFYAVLIILLFTASFFWRRYAVEAQAARLAVQEQNRGEVELSGAVIRLSLTGLRGLATCYLWVTAMDKQKKHQWNELEFYVRSTAKLQPHFITPWLFQGWNLSYNVSVELDRPLDKYFYVARGVLLLTEGERRNRHNPDLRWSIGFTMQHKIAQSDETNILRSIFQLSCIPPNRRDPARFYRINEEGVREFSWVEFEKFCKENPKLVRRLREGLRKETRTEQERQFTCERPEDVVQLLQECWRIPSHYQEAPLTPEGVAWIEKQDRLLPLDERYPALPPSRNPPPPQHLFQPAYDFEELTQESQLGDDTDAFVVGRAWYGYAQEPIPDPSDLPGISEPVTDRIYQRKPKMTALIFRSYPALAQSLHAHSLQQEGWFDTTPWVIPGWFQPLRNRFADGSLAQLSVKEEQSSLKGWRDCFRMWEKHGQTNHLVFNNPVDEINMNRLGQQHWSKYGGLFYSQPNVPEGREDVLPPEDREAARAARYLYEYKSYRDVSNFPHHYHRASVEADEETVTARRLFYRAETYRLQASPEEALRAYLDPGALEAWREKVLAWRDIDHHREFRQDAFTQEETYETQLKYMTLRREWQARPFKEELVQLLTWLGQAGQGQLTQSGAGVLLVNPYLATLRVQGAAPLAELEVFREPFAVPVLNEKRYTEFATMVAGVVGSPALPTPFMAVTTLAAGNRPLISEEVIQLVLQRKNLVPQPPQKEAAAEASSGPSSKAGP